MPVPDGRADDPVVCTICGHQFGVIGDYDDGEELDCPECPERYRLELPTPEALERAREQARELLADPSVGGVDNPDHEDALVKVRTVRLTGGS